MAEFCWNPKSKEYKQIQDLLGGDKDGFYTEKILNSYLEENEGNYEGRMRSTPSPEWVADHLKNNYPSQNFNLDMDRWYRWSMGERDREKAISHTEERQFANKRPMEGYEDLERRQERKQQLINQKRDFNRTAKFMEAQAQSVEGEPGHGTVTNLGKPIPEGEKGEKQTRAQEIGTSIHNLWDRITQKGEKGLSSYVLQKAREGDPGFLSMADSNTVNKFCESMVGIHDKLKERYEILGSEVNVAMNNITGRIDLVLHDKETGENIVCEVKTETTNDFNKQYSSFETYKGRAVDQQGHTALDNAQLQTIAYREFANEANRQRIAGEPGYKEGTPIPDLINGRGMIQLEVLYDRDLDKVKDIRLNEPRSEATEGGVIRLLDTPAHVNEAHAIYGAGKETSQELADAILTYADIDKWLHKMDRKGMQHIGADPIYADRLKKSGFLNGAGDFGTAWAEVRDQSRKILSRVNNERMNDPRTLRDLSSEVMAMKERMSYHSEQEVNDAFDEYCEKVVGLDMSNEKDKQFADDMRNRVNKTFREAKIATGMADFALQEARTRRFESGMATEIRDSFKEIYKSSPVGKIHPEARKKAFEEAKRDGKDTRNFDTKFAKEIKAWEEKLFEQNRVFHEQAIDRMMRCAEGVSSTGPGGELLSNMPNLLTSKGNIFNYVTMSLARMSYLTTPLNTPNPIMQHFYKVMEVTGDVLSMNMENESKKMQALVEALAKRFGGRINSQEDFKRVYDFMLDFKESHDEYGNKIVRQSRIQEFNWDKYHEDRAKAAKEGKEAEFLAQHKVTKGNMGTEKALDALTKDIIAEVAHLKEQGRISEDVAKEFEEAITNTEKGRLALLRPGMEKMVDHPEWSFIVERAKEMEDKYFMPGEAYMTDKYKAILAMDENDPRRLFYEAAKDISDRYDKVVPKSKRLGFNLPSVRVQKREGMAGGIKGWFAPKSTEDQYEKNRQQGTINGNPEGIYGEKPEDNAYHVALPFSGTNMSLTAEEQSYDLGNMYLDLARSYHKFAILTPMAHELDLAISQFKNNKFNDSKEANYYRPTDREIRTFEKALKQMVSGKDSTAWAKFIRFGSAATAWTMLGLSPALAWSSHVRSVADINGRFTGSILSKKSYFQANRDFFGGLVSSKLGGGKGMSGADAQKFFGLENENLRNQYNTIRYSKTEGIAPNLPKLMDNVMRMSMSFFSMTDATVKGTTGLRLLHSCMVKDAEGKELGSLYENMVKGEDGRWNVNDKVATLVYNDGREIKYNSAGEGKISLDRTMRRMISETTMAVSSLYRPELATNYGHLGQMSTIIRTIGINSLTAQLTPFHYDSTSQEWRIGTLSALGERGALPGFIGQIPIIRQVLQAADRILGHDDTLKPLYMEEDYATRSEGLHQWARRLVSREAYMGDRLHPVVKERLRQFANVVAAQAIMGYVMANIREDNDNKIMPSIPLIDDSWLGSYFHDMFNESGVRPSGDTNQWCRNFFSGTLGLICNSLGPMAGMISMMDAKNQGSVALASLTRDKKFMVDLAEWSGGEMEWWDMPNTLQQNDEYKGWYIWQKMLYVHCLRLNVFEQIRSFGMQRGKKITTEGIFTGALLGI